MLGIDKLFATNLDYLSSKRSKGGGASVLSDVIVEVP